MALEVRFQHFACHGQAHLYNIMAQAEILASCCHGKPYFYIIMTLHMRFQRLGPKRAMWECFYRACGVLAIWIAISTAFRNVFAIWVAVSSAFMVSASPFRDDQAERLYSKVHEKYSLVRGDEPGE